ncbi:hypothetical protein KCU90_g91, partial [Aureobasidium melanogenum]
MVQDSPIGEKSGGDFVGRVTLTRKIITPVLILSAIPTIISQSMSFASRSSSGSSMASPIRRTKCNLSPMPLMNRLRNLQAEVVRLVTRIS